MRCLVSATSLVIALASPVLAADTLSGAWTTGGPAPQTFVFKASGDRFGGIACGPCDRAASVFRVEDGRILDANQAGNVRFVLVGLGLMLLLIFRPQGIFGDRREIALQDR